jgi:hypothetical protein
LLCCWNSSRIWTGTWFSRGVRTCTAPPLPLQRVIFYSLLVLQYLLELDSFDEANYAAGQNKGARLHVVVDSGKAHLASVTSRLRTYVIISTWLREEGTARRTPCTCPRNSCVTPAGQSEPVDSSSPLRLESQTSDSLQSSAAPLPLGLPMGTPGLATTSGYGATVTTGALGGDVPGGTVRSGPPTIVTGLPDQLQDRMPGVGSGGGVGKEWRVPLPDAQNRVARPPAVLPPSLATAHWLDV